MPTSCDLVLSIVVAFALCVDGRALLGSDDLGWHLVVGRRILSTWEVPRADWLTFTHAGQPFVAWEWLWEAAAALVERLVGLGGLQAASALLAGATFVRIYRSMVARGDLAIVSIVVVLWAALASWVHAFARPHLVSWLLTWLMWEALPDGRVTRARVIALVTMFVVWASVHPGFMTALVVLGARVLGLAIEGDRSGAIRLGMIAMALGAATLANPWGAWLHLHALAATQTERATNVEFAPPDLWAIDKPLVGLVAVALAATLLSRPRPRAADIVPAAAMLALALASARFIPLAAMLAAWVAAGALSRWVAGAEGGVPRLLLAASIRMRTMDARIGRSMWPALLAIVVVWAGAGGGRIGPWRLFDAGFSPQTYPVEAVEVLARRPPGRLLADAGWGGYVAWRTARGSKPVYPTFIDNRFDMHGPARIQEFLALDSASTRWAETLERWGVRYLLLTRVSRLGREVVRDPRWRRVHEDAVAVLVERAPPRRPPP